MVKDSIRLNVDSNQENKKQSASKASQVSKLPTNKRSVKKSSPIKSVICIKPRENGKKKVKGDKLSSVKAHNELINETRGNQLSITKNNKQSDINQNEQKELQEERLLFQGADVNKEIYFCKPSDQDLSEYSEAISIKKDINFSLNIFLSEKYNTDNSKLLIADLRDMEISTGKNENKFNLKGANFRGALFRNTRFLNCDLTNAYFSDSWLKGVQFNYSTLTHVDLRGCNLEECSFGKEYANSDHSTSNNIKLSLSLSELRIFADIKNDIARKNEEQRLLDAKRYEMREISKRTSLYQKISWNLGMKINNASYKRVMEELQHMEEGKFTKEYIVHKSAEYLVKNRLCSFYPVFGKGFQDVNRIKHKKYVKLTREDLEEFTAITDNQVTISLNEFAKEKYLAAQDDKNNLPDNTMIVADLSSKVNKFGNNEWNRMNLNGISFINRDMSFVNFSGTDLSKCNFSTSNLHGANLDCCNLSESIFTGTNLTDCSMVNVDLNGSVFEDVNLVRSNISWSNLIKVRIIDSNIAYVNLHNSNLNKCYFENLVVDGSIFDNTNLEKSRFIKSSFHNTSFLKSKWHSVKMEGVSFNGSVFNKAIMKNSFWGNVELKNVEAMNVDLTESKFSEGSIIDNSNFRYALLDAVRVSLCKIVNSDFDYAKIAYGKFGGVDFLGSHFRFSDFNNVSFAECNAENTDFSGAKMYNARLVKTNFRNSNFSGSNITDSDLTGASFENAIWYCATLNTSVLENVNNHRIKVNDSTMINKCILKKLEGQFYHYDQDDFMEIMFIEQQQSHQKYIQNILKMKKMGVMSYILKFFIKDYDVSIKDRNLIIKSRRRNRVSLKNHFREIRDTPKKPFIDMDEFYIKNLISSHNI